MDLIHTVFIDEENLLVQGIKSLLNVHNISGFSVDGHYQKLSDFLRVHTEECSLVITDLDIQDPDVIDHVPLIKKKYPGIRVIVLTKFDNFKLVRDTMKAGADGYLLKNSSFGDLIKCIEEVMEGKAHIGEGLQLTPPRRLFESKKDVNTETEVIRKYEDRYQVRQKLTKRELEILQLVAQAKNNKEIAGELYISDQTVGVHKKNIMRKLNVRSTISLIKYAMEQNLV
jgi:DNA-binding NarL/FixJ family response regulator